MKATDKSNKTKPDSSTHEELSTDLPISEKDEVKKAEENTRQTAGRQASAAADLKNRQQHQKPEKHK